MTGFERFVTPVYRRNNGYVMLKVMRLPETLFLRLKNMFLCCASRYPRLRKVCIIHTNYIIQIANLQSTLLYYNDVDQFAIRKFGRLISRPQT